MINKFSLLPGGGDPQPDPDPVTDVEIGIAGSNGMVLPKSRTGQSDSIKINVIAHDGAMVQSAKARSRISQPNAGTQ